MKLNWVRVLSVILAGSALVAGPVAALEAPSVTVLQSKPGSVRLMVNAGESGAPAGFFVDRMTKVEFDAFGGWPTEGAVTRVTGSFTGVPTFNIEGTADAYVLAPGEAIEVELGQLFDETGVTATDTEELDAATEYVVRIRANGIGGDEPSPFTETMVVSSSALAANCTYTLGFWKNHTGVWPVTNLTLGTVNYTAAELLAFLEEPAGGNKLLILFHQLIAAKLNLANGADPSAAAATIALSDALIGSLVPPPSGGDGVPASPATTYSNLLDDFNNGIIGPGHCGTTPTSAATWGLVKASYRR